MFLIGLVTLPIEMNPSILISIASIPESSEWLCAGEQERGGGVS